MPDPNGCVTIEFSEKKGPHKQECECIWAKYFVKAPLLRAFHRNSASTREQCHRNTVPFWIIHIIHRAVLLLSLS